MFDAPELLKSFLSGYRLLLLQFGDVIISGEQLVEGQQSKHKHSQVPNAESNLLMCLHLHINKRKNTLMGWLCRQARRQQMRRDNRKIPINNTESDFLIFKKVGQGLHLVSTSCHHGFLQREERGIQKIFTLVMLNDNEWNLILSQPVSPCRYCSQCSVLHQPEWWNKRVSSAYLMSSTDCCVTHRCKESDSCAPDLKYSVAVWSSHHLGKDLHSEQDYHALWWSCFEMIRSSLHRVIVCAAASECESLMMVGFPCILIRMCSRGLVPIAPPGVVCFLSARTKRSQSLTLVLNWWQRLMESLYVGCVSVVCVCEVGV